MGKAQSPFCSLSAVETSFTTRNWERAEPSQTSSVKGKPARENWRRKEMAKSVTGARNELKHDA